jgi:hypothetical protein
MDSRTQLAELQRRWTPPDGLELPRLRQVRWTAAGKTVFALAVVFLVGGLAAGIALEVAALGQAEEQRLLVEQGADTQGLVTKLWRSGDEGHTRWVAYRFTVQERTYPGRAKAPLRIWKNLQVGSELAVRYLPSRPALNYPRGSEPMPMPIWVPWLVAAAVSATGGLFTLPLRRQGWLLAQGRPAPAVVTRHAKTDKGTLVHYEFQTLSGSMAKGGSGPTRKPLAIGATLCVFYDPDNPRRNAPYPLPLVEPVHIRKTPARS